MSMNVSFHLGEIKVQVQRTTGTEKGFVAIIDSTEDYMNLFFRSPEDMAAMSLEMQRVLWLETGKHYAACEANDCNAVHATDEMVQLVDGSYVCGNCAEDKVHPCVECKGVQLETMMQPARELGEYVCDDCFDEAGRKSAHEDRQYHEAKEMGCAM